MNRIIIAGGGTGGHIFPAIAIANALKRLQPDIGILFVGAKGKMEMEKVPQAGYKIEGLEITGFDRGALLKNMALPLKLLKSGVQANRIFKQFRPDAVIGVGGYASFPMLYLAQWKGIPTIIQEQNSYAGKANNILGRKASKICVAYEGMGRFFPEEKIIVTGNPVREAITGSAIKREEARSFFELNVSGKTVLAVGGSLGARSINESLELHIDEFIDNGVQLIWQTGKPYYEKAKAAAARHETGIRVFEFIYKMEAAYAAADVVISRAGALAISELCAAKKPAVLVPYPYAAEDHQTQNALSLVNKNAALMVTDADARQELVAKTLHLLADEKMQEILISNISGLGIADADKRIATAVLKLLK